MASDPKLSSAPIPIPILKASSVLRSYQSSCVHAMAKTVLSSFAIDCRPHGQNTISLEEVARHDSITDCWVVIYDRVYDLTDFIEEHPGGSDILLEYAGRDASVAFRSSGHSRQTVEAIHRFAIGELPVHERIFRKNGGFRLSDVPD